MPMNRVRRAGVFFRSGDANAQRFRTDAGRVVLNLVRGGRGEEERIPHRRRGWDVTATLGALVTGKHQGQTSTGVVIARDGIPSYKSFEQGACQPSRSDVPVIDASGRNCARLRSITEALAGRCVGGRAIFFDVRDAAEPMASPIPHLRFPRYSRVLADLAHSLERGPRYAQGTGVFSAAHVPKIYGAQACRRFERAVGFMFGSNPLTRGAT